MRFLVLAALILSGCTRKPTPNEGTTVPTRASTAPTASASVPAAAAAEGGEPSWAPPKPKLKPEASVCTKGVVTECEFWRAALRQTLRLDPPCAEDDPNFRYPWGSDGVKLRRLKIQYPGAKSCDVDLGDSITIRCYFPLRAASESATTRARIWLTSTTSPHRRQLHFPIETTSSDATSSSGSQLASPSRARGNPPGCEASGGRFSPGTITPGQPPSSTAAHLLASSPRRRARSRRSSRR